VRTPLALAILSRLLRSDDREEILGDLEERYLRRRKRSGTIAATLWLWHQALPVPLKIAADRCMAGRVRQRSASPEHSHRNYGRGRTASESLLFDHLSRNLRFTCRALRTRPLFFLIPVLSLTIGIGANTVVFSALNKLLLQGMGGVPNAARAVEIGTGTNGAGFRELNYPDILDLREQSTVLDEVAGYKYQMFTLSRGEAGVRAFGLLVSANYFDVLGVRALHGRTFLPEEDRDLDAHPVAVLSYSFWQNRWGADPDVVGSTVYLSRQPYTVVGIAPPDFGSHAAVGNPDVYVPLMQHPSLNQGRNQFETRGSVWLPVLASVVPGASVEEANAEVVTVFQRLSEEYPGTNARRTASVRRYGALPVIMRSPATVFMATMMGFVALILVITCTNVAGMFVARAAARQKEIAIRLAIGSSRGQLLQQLLTESMVVSVIGGIGGVAFAVWVLRYLSSLTLPGPFPVQVDISPDGGALLFALALTLLTGVFFGLLPARHAFGLSLLNVLKNEGARPRSTEGRLRRGFVAAQVAASLVLLVAAGLLARALQHAGEIDTGFDADGAYVTFVDLSTEGYVEEDGSVFQTEVLEHFSALPWVESVALSIDLPSDLSTHGTSVTPEGWEGSENRDDLATRYNAVSPEYFSALRIGVIEGRGFEEADRAGAEEVAIVSRALAERVWPDESAVGRRMQVAGTDITVVGVTQDVPNALLTEDPEALLYRPLSQAYGEEINLVLRSSADHALIARETHRGLRALDPRISLSPVIELRRFTEVGILPQRIAGCLATSLGILALLLSTMGVYGVMAFAVAQRRREMGIRMALGARSGRVLGAVIFGALRITLPGLIVGALLALAVGVVLQSLLLGVSPRDPVALFGAALAVGGMVVAGTFIPARRAASTDPVEALKYE
jgi:predicted permease